MLKGNSANLKAINTKHVLKCIVDNEANTRADIAKRLNFSKPTVSSIVNQLLEDKWIYETGNGSASPEGGRKPIQLAFNAKRSYIIGIDIGGTNVLLGMTDLNGEVCASRQFITRYHLNNDLFQEMKRCVESMFSQLQITASDVLGLGVGVPGITNVEEGVVIEAPALGWENFPVRDRFHEIFDFPVYVDNDVNSVILGEHWKGAARHKSNLIYIAIGTGIGSGIILNGELYRGSNYSAGEIGYLVTDREDVKNFQPVFKGYGYLESVASGSSIGRQLSSRLGREVTAKEAFELYRNNDPEAVKIINCAVENLGIALANYISLFDPELIILGGGVSRSFSAIQERVLEIIKQYAPQQCEIMQTSLGENAGVIGAAALFLKKHELIFHI